MGNVNILTMPQPKRKLQATSPPKRKVKGSTTSEVYCLICEEPILEVDENGAGEDGLFCEGNAMTGCIESVPVLLSQLSQAR